MAGLQSQASDTDADYVLVANMDNVKNLSQLLRAVHFKETATVFASTSGLKVTVEDAKCVQANAFIQSSVFQEYIIREDTVTFKINLTVLLECLNIFGSSTLPSTTTALKMCYSGYGSPLILILEEGGVVTDCRITTQEPEEILDFEFSPANVVNKIIMKSEILKEAWNDLDMNSDFVQILMSPEKPFLHLSTMGSVGTIHIDFSKESDMVELFQCTQTQTNRYKVSLLKPSLKALVQSMKTSIRTDERGFLCLQYMIRTEDGHICFVEYFCTPDEEIEDDGYR